jgi:hypothetical protein
MTGEVALIHEQGQDFAVLAVRSHVVQNAYERENAMTAGCQAFGVPTALVAENGRTWGPPGIVRWLEGVTLDQLPWRSFTV